MRTARVTARTAVAASLALFLLAYVLGGRDAALENAAYAEAARYGWPRESLHLLKFTNADLGSRGAPLARQGSVALLGRRPEVSSG